jgi:hypothetical protein
MAILLVKSQDNASGIPIQHRWMRGDIVSAREWDTNPGAPSGFKESPPNFDLIIAAGYDKDYLQLQYITPWTSGNNIIRRSLWKYVHESGVLQNKQTNQIKTLDDL